MRKEPLTLLFKRLTELKKKKSIKKPLFIKLSPDIDNKEISNIIELIFKYNIEGIILSNTSDKNREDLFDVLKKMKKEDFLASQSKKFQQKLSNVFTKK